MEDHIMPIDNSVMSQCAVESQPHITHTILFPSPLAHICEKIKAVLPPGKPGHLHCLKELAKQRFDQSSFDGLDLPL